MNRDEIIVLLCLWTIVFSGVFINVTRRAPRSTATDNSLIWFRILSPLGLLLSLVFYYAEIGAFPESISALGGSLPLLTVIGVFLFVAGMSLRWSAIYALGKAFTVGLTVSPLQTLITKGVFRYIRHPSYTGLLMYYIGLGILMFNWICILILFVLPLIAVLNRIRYEERILRSHFGESYSGYMEISKKLIPWLY